VHNVAMGFQIRFWKNVGPFRVNLSRRGVTGSFGTRWMRILLGGGSKRGTIRVPGRGLSWTRQRKWK